MGVCNVYLKHAPVLRSVGLVPHSGVSLLLGFSAMCCGRISQPTATGYLPFIFQLFFGVRVYFDRGCRFAPGLGLLERHLFTLLAGRRSVRTCELSSDVMSLPVQCFAGSCTATAFVRVVFFPRIMRVPHKK